jgi:uncharacterized protein YbjT (DUF2867 family)
MSPSLVLVTGSTGTIGTEVIQALVSVGVPVRAAYNSSRSLKKLEALGVTETVQLDMSDSSSLDAAFQGVSKAFLLVPFTAEIVELGQALIDAAQRAKLQYVVRLSGFGADADASTLVGQWHGQLDQYLKLSNLAYTIIQPNFFMQNFITFYGDLIKSQNAIYMPYGDATVSWVDARDIGAVVATCLQNPDIHIGKTYVLTGSEALNNHAIAAQFSQVLGRTITYHDIPDGAAIEAMEQQQLPPIIVQALAELNGVAKAGYSAVLSPDVEAVTGQAARSFSQFIEDYQTAWMP